MAPVAAVAGLTIGQLELGCHALSIYGPHIMSHVPNKRSNSIILALSLAPHTGGRYGSINNHLLQPLLLIMLFFVNVSSSLLIVGRCICVGGGGHMVCVVNNFKRCLRHFDEKILNPCSLQVGVQNKSLFYWF